MPLRQTQAGRNRGVTLVEVLAALAIFSFAIIPLTVLFRYSIHGTRDAGHLFSGVQLADGVMKHLTELAYYDDLRDPGEPKRTSFTLTDIALKSKDNPQEIALDLSPKTINGIKYHFSLAVEEFNPSFKVFITDKAKGNVETDYTCYRQVKRLALTVWWKGRLNRKEITIECLKPDI